MARRFRAVTLLAGAAVICAATPAGAQEVSAADVQTNLDNVFVLVSAILVIFMQAGFALVESGLTRAKSVANIMLKNLMDFCAGALAFFAVGYAIPATASPSPYSAPSSSWWVGTASTRAPSWPPTAPSGASP